jgi:integrase/recombinase XerD
MISLVHISSLILRESMDYVNDSLALVGRWVFYVQIYMFIENSTPLSSAVEVYLDWKATYTHSACDRYKVRLNHFMRYIGAEMDINLITNNHIQAFTNYLRNSFTASGTLYSDTTIAYSVNILKDFFGFWRGRGVSQINPKEIRAIRHIKNYREHVTAEDIEELFTALDEHYYEDVQKKLVISLLWDTGMRVSELVQLDLEDIKPMSQNKTGSAIVRTRKTMRYNLVVWGSETTRLLHLYLGVRLLKKYDTDALLVSKKSRKRITNRTIQRWLKELCQQAMIDKEITPHSFRHGKAHHMLNNGANHRDITAVLRHANPMSSFHYLSMNETHFRQVAEKYV